MRFNETFLIFQSDLLGSRSKLDRPKLVNTGWRKRFALWCNLEIFVVLAPGKGVGVCEI